MPSPNLFLVGAPKAGTTSIFDYLSTHPNAFMSVPKEPHFFAKDREGMSSVKGMSEYLQLFKDADPAVHKVIGEGSTSYINSEVALEKIAQFAPGAKIIVALRHPIDLVYSYHAHFCFRGEEDVLDFETAWTLQEERAQGRHLPSGCRHPFYTQYLQQGLLGKQVQRVLSFFPPEQVKIVFFEDLARSPRKTYLDILAFLDLPDDGRTEFATKNATMQVARGRGIVSFLMNLPGPLFKLWSFVKRTAPWLNDLISGAVYSVLTKSEKRKPLDPQFYNALLTVFESDIRLLESLSGRDLSHWLIPKQIGAETEDEGIDVDVN